jgi:hypothetical protein
MAWMVFRRGKITGRPPFAAQSISCGFKTRLLLSVDKQLPGQQMFGFHPRCSRSLSPGSIFPLRLDHPHAWAFDAVCCTEMFMMAGALYAVGRPCAAGVYGFFRPRTQAAIDQPCTRLFHPGIVAMAYAGYTYAAESWAINEHSNVTADGPPSIL